MTYAGINMFMEKLNQLISCNYNPLFNNPEIICERPQFQLLYEELGSMIQTLLIDQHQDLHDLQKLNDLKQRFTYAVEEAQYIVDLFLSEVRIRNDDHFYPLKKSLKFFVDLFLSFVHFGNNGHVPRSLNLDDVRRSLKSIKVEFMSMRTDSMKTNSSRRTERTVNQSASAKFSITENSSGSKELMGETFVGLNHDAKLIIDKLVEGRKKVDVISVVGMGGIGKTTLATKVFNDSFVKYHFHVRAWVSVSQTYHKRGVLIQVLKSFHGQVELEKATDSQLHELVHKHLMVKRYFIVIDDIWHKETWNDLKLIFPHNNNGSRILLTSRVTEVAKHAKSDGFIHHLGYMNKEKSWELLCQKVFHGNECPEWTKKPGMKIAENCQGLPLSVVVIAGILAKEELSEKFWWEIAERTGPYIVGEQNGCLETLALSYYHLPLHLRECFLYLGGFPEDYKFKVQRLIWLWVAEGFIEQVGDRSLEDIAEDYLMDLIDRNLVIVADKRNTNGGVKACKVHDLVRELCLKKAKEEQFTIETKRLMSSSQISNVITPTYKTVRMFMNKDVYIQDFPNPSAKNIRSILCFSYFRHKSDHNEMCFRSFVLLRVLDLQKCELNGLPKGVELLVHLRYLAIWISPEVDFPSSICKLWNLQTLIYVTTIDNFGNCGSIVLPSNISDLVNLRHLLSFDPYSRKINKRDFFICFTEKPLKLETISKVQLEDKFQKCVPYIKKLTCYALVDEENDFKSLTYLEKLNLTGALGILNRIKFPATLKSLTLVECDLPWSDMSIIQSLPNLQVLKLEEGAFTGSCWNTYEHVFQQLKLLKLEMLNIQQLEAFSSSFPCLRQLEVFWCENLEEIPIEIADITTLELIKIKKCRKSVGESVRRIEEEQHGSGNYDLKIEVTRMFDSLSNPAKQILKRPPLKLGTNQSLRLSKLRERKSKSDLREREQHFDDAVNEFINTLKLPPQPFTRITSSSRDPPASFSSENIGHLSSDTHRSKIRKCR